MKKIILAAVVLVALGASAPAQAQAGPFGVDPARSAAVNGGLLLGAVGAVGGCAVGSFWGACPVGAAVGGISGGLVGWTFGSLADAAAPAQPPRVVRARARTKK